MPTQTSAGYSGRPLVDKLGIKPGHRLLAVAAPKDYRELLAPLPDDLVWEKQLTSATDIIHVFVTRKAALISELGRYCAAMRDDATIWVSWPKKTAKVATDVTEDVVRDTALGLGLVDVKVCAVTDVWSGLRLVIRKELRGKVSRRERPRKGL